MIIITIILLMQIIMIMTKKINGNSDKIETTILATI